MPNLQRVTVPDFEVVCRDRVLSSLGSLACLRSFNIRVYLQSKRRDPAFKAIFNWFEWDMPTLARLMASCPSLREFTVAHQPIDCYHIMPDTVCAPNTSRHALAPHQASLTSLSLRETFIDDAGLFYLLKNSCLKQLSILSCEGITSSAITKDGLLQALKLVGPTVESMSAEGPLSCPNQLRTNRLNVKKCRSRRDDSLASVTARVNTRSRRGCQASSSGQKPHSCRQRSQRCLSRQSTAASEAQQAWSDRL